MLEWCFRDLSLDTGLRPRSLSGIEFFHEFLGLAKMCIYAIGDIKELTVSCSSQSVATVPVKVPGLTSLTLLTI